MDGAVRSGEARPRRCSGRCGGDEGRAGLALVAALAAAALPSAAQAQVTPDQAAELGREAYRYGIPLLEFLRIRTEMTQRARARRPRQRARQHVQPRTGFARPSDRTVVAPNHDTLYSLAQLDLGKGPILLSHPDMGRRYFDFELVDPYTNVIGYVGRGRPERGRGASRSPGPASPATGCRGSR